MARASRVAVRAVRRAATASTMSVAAGWRRNLPDGPIFTGTTSHSTPQSRISCANAASERTSPGVVASEIRTMSVKGARVVSPRVETPCNRGGSDVQPGVVPGGDARLAGRSGLRRRVADDRGRRRLDRLHASGDRALRRARVATACLTWAERRAQPGLLRILWGSGGAGGRRHLGAAGLAAGAGGGR